MQQRLFDWMAIVVIGFVAIVGVSAASAIAARTEASAFELTFEGTLERPPWVDEVVPGYTSEGTFRSRAPFCAAGTFVDDVRPDFTVETTRRLTCDDGSGDLTISLVEGWYYRPWDTWNTTWKIVDGTGGYTDLRGKGTLRGELLDGEIDAVGGGKIIWRSTLEGVADQDAVAPTIDISSPSVTKLRRPAGAYSVEVALSLRDNVEGNRVSYTLRVMAGRAEFARRAGTVESGVVPLVLRVRHLSAKAKAVQLELTASDPVGNAVSMRRLVRLPK
jgi:hypothetical protein